jgi:hypothetical protein
MVCFEMDSPKNRFAPLDVVSDAIKR